jgi:hypothetical protein
MQQLVAKQTSAEKNANMRIRELHEDTDGDANLITILQFLRNRAHNKKLTPTVSTQSLVNMVKNQGGSEWFTFDNLSAAQERNPAVSELIKSLDKEKVTLTGFGDEIDASEVEQAAANKEQVSKANPEKTVQAMAKRAAANRS